MIPLETTLLNGLGRLDAHADAFTGVERNVEVEIAATCDV